ncbi:MAG: hypothetical protein WD872_17025 [Pirellulaceae bacterium]
MANSFLSAVLSLRPISVTATQTAARRRAGTLLEVTIALMILLVAVGGLATLLTTAAAHRRVGEQRRLAQQEVANRAERIALLSWDELTPESLAAQSLSDEVAAAVPNARLQLVMDEEAEAPRSKRVRIELHSKDSAGLSTQPAGLTVWKHPPLETAP